MSFSTFDKTYGHISKLFALALLVGVTGCATRPTSAVLQPLAIKQDQSQKVTLLAVTNRNHIVAENGFGSERAQGVSYERYSFSVPADRDGAALTYPAKTPDPRRQYIVTQRQSLTENALVKEAVQAKNFDGTVAVFVHGYNYSYQEALFRTAQMAADANKLASPIMFSWPSAASVAGYVADRDAALYSRTQLSDLIMALAHEPKIRRVILFGHSMGGFLSMEVTRQLKLKGRNDVINKLQVVLAAPDIDFDVFRSQLNDIGRTPNPITLLVSKTDRALSISSFVGGERPRIGLLDINDPLIQETAKEQHVQVVDISSIQSSDGLGHDRYASLAKFGNEILSADDKMRKNGNNIGAFVFDAAGAAVASPFKLAGALVRQ